MPEMSQEEKNRIIRALERKGATLPCPRCGEKNFTLLDGYFNQPITTELGAFVLGGPTIPSAVIACTNCGYLSQHALVALGLLQKSEEKENDE